MSLIVGLFKFKDEKELACIMAILRNVEGCKEEGNDYFIYPEGRVNLTINKDRKTLLCSMSNGIERLPKFKNALSKIEGGAFAC